MIMPPIHERMEEQARNQPELDAMYNELSSRSVPASYNAVSKGLYCLPNTTIIHHTIYNI